VKAHRDHAFRVAGCGVVVLAVAFAFCSSPQPLRTTTSRLEALESRIDSGIELPRPRLPADADSNAAAAYYHWGEPLVRFGLKLDTAEMALYWASRLDPAWPDPLYARGLLVLQALQHDAFETWFKTRSVRATKRVAITPRQVQLVDSLMRIAWARNPFLFNDLEFRGLAPGRRGDPMHDGWLAFSSRHFGAADSLFGLALAKHPEDIGVRIYRARALFFLGRYDRAVAELAAARDSLRGRTEAQLSAIVPSVEMFEYAIGIARVQQDDFPAARAAFQRALTENLAFYWAHVRLAGAALALRDTGTALAELDMAVQLEGRDPALRLYDGVVLAGAGRLDEAAVQLEQAIALDPYYAAPYYWLATVSRAQGRAREAVDQYRQFLAHAARLDPDRHRALVALGELGASLPDSGN